jgi:DNA-binding transcriptional LysR family regulator
MNDLAPLRYFRSAYETGTFSAAARLNEVRQPSVSAAIARLEAHYGEPLFHRGAAGLVPTDLGRELYQMAGVVLNSLNQMEDRLARRVRPVLRLYCFADVLTSPFEQGLRAITRDAEGAVLQFTDDAALADVVLCAEDCAPQGMPFRSLWEEGYGVALPVGHALSREAELSLADLAEVSMIARPYCPSADLFGGVLQDPDPEKALPVAAKAMHDAQLLDLVAAGLGVALVPMSHGRASRRIVVRPLRDAKDVRRRMGIAHRRTSFAAGAADRLASALTGQGA